MSTRFLAVRAQTKHVPTVGIDYIKAAIIFPHLHIKYKTPDVCLAAVQYDGTNIKFVPWYELTDEMCHAAIQKNALAFMLLNKKYQTPDLCLIAVQSPKMFENECRFKDISSHFFKSCEIADLICLAAVRTNGEVALKRFFSESINVTPEMIFTAVKRNGMVLRILPKHLLTAELCWTAITQTGLALQFVPRELQTLDMCIAAVKQDRRALAFILDPDKSL